MGNVLGTGRDREGGGILPMNIVEGQNDLNYPHSYQMYYFVLHGMIPLLGVCLFAYTAKKFKEERSQMENTCVTINQFMSAAKKAIKPKPDLEAPSGWSLSKNDTIRLLQKLEDDGQRASAVKMKEIDYYERELEKILDIRCSLFKRKTNRESMQEELINNLTRPDNPLHDLNIYDGLKDIFRYDYLFCSQRKKDNGKFRHLYLENWRLQVELNKQREIIDRLKSQLKG